MLRFIAVYLILGFGIIAQNNDENCETLMSEVHITKGIDLQKIYFSDNCKFPNLIN